MRAAFAVAFTALFATSCATTSGDGSSSNGTRANKRDIQSVTFITGSPPLPAALRRNRTLTVNRDLSASLKITNGYNAVLSEKSGKVKQEQFSRLKDKLSESNYIYLKPKKRDALLVGSGTRTVIITSDLGAHRFIGNAQSELPELIQTLFESRADYLPIISKAP